VNIDDALPTFFAEAGEILREMETDLLACTSAAPSADDVNRIFRAAHTLKGSAGLFGFDAIVEFVHEIEALLDRVRLGKAVLDTQRAAVLLECNDHVEKLLALAANGNAQPDPELLASQWGEPAATHRPTVSQPAPLAYPEATRGTGARPAHRGTLKTVATVASYGLAVIGFVMMAMAVARTFGASLKYIYTRPLIINALRTNGNQAEMLCKSEPHTYFGAVGAAIKAGAMVGSRDLGVISGVTAPTYDAQGQAILMNWSTSLGKVKLAFMAAAGGVLIGASKGFPPVIVIILAVLVGIGFLRLYFYKVEIERCLVRARAEILPEVDRSFADGRYVFPPR